MIATLRKISVMSASAFILASILMPFFTATAKQSPTQKDTSWHQHGYWFRDDDGSEAEATGWGLRDLQKNGDIVITDAAQFQDGALRLRMGVSAKKTGGTLTPRLAFKNTGTAGDCNDGDWTLIKDTETPFAFRSSSHTADGTGTTQQLDNGSGFVSGLFLGMADTAPAITLEKNSRTEYEWSLQYNKPFIAEMATYTLRVTDNGLPFDTYGTCPAISITPPAPTITFTITPTSITHGESALISWSASSAIACNAAANPADVDWSGEKPLSGTQNVASAQSTSYGITCANGSGSTTQSISLTVDEAPPPPPPVVTPPTPISQSGPSERPLPPSSITFSGATSPGAHVKIVARDRKYERDIPIKEIVSADNGSFEIQFVDTQGFSFYTFIVIDKEGRLAHNQMFNFDTPGYAVLKKDFLVSPTLGFARSTVSKGDVMTFIGYATPESDITIRVDPDRTITTKTEKDGSYRVIMSTGGLAYGLYAATATQHGKDGAKNASSPKKIFSISRLMNPRVDFDGSGAVDIRDLSIFAARWASTDPKKRTTIDLNGDGAVTISDLSVFIRTMKQ